MEDINFFQRSRNGLRDLDRILPQVVENVPLEIGGRQDRNKVARCVVDFSIVDGPDELNFNIYVGVPIKNH